MSRGRQKTQVNESGLRQEHNSAQTSTKTKLEYRYEYSRKEVLKALSGTYVRTCSHTSFAYGYGSQNPTRNSIRFANGSIRSYAVDMLLHHSTE